jgi:hypothetical protein
MPCRHSGQELVPCAAYRSKMFGIGGFLFEFSAQLQYVVVDSTSTRIALVSPHFVEEFVPGDYSSGILN